MIRLDCLRAEGEAAAFWAEEGVGQPQWMLTCEKEKAKEDFFENSGLVVVGPQMGVAVLQSLPPELHLALEYHHWDWDLISHHREAL